MTTLWPKVWRPSSCCPTCAAATTNRPASIARARSSTCQCARPARDRECRGHRDHISVGLGKPGKQSRKTHVVTNSEAELADRRSVDEHHSATGRIDTGFAPEFASGKVDIEQMKLVVSGADFALAVDYESAVARPCRSPSARRASRGEARSLWRAAESRQAASTRSASWFRSDLAARAASRSSSPDISGVNRISAPPAAAWSIAPVSTCALAAGSIPVVDWNSAILVMPRSSRLACRRAPVPAARRSRRCGSHR